MAQIDFKNVGHISGTVASVTQNVTPIGIKTPLRLGFAADGIFSMHTSLGEQIRDNLRNLLLTNRGERVCFNDLGANLRPLMFELSTDQFESVAASRIKSTVSKYMPFVSLKTLTTANSIHDNDIAVLKMQVIYDVPMLALVDQGIELTFFIGG